MQDSKRKVNTLFTIIYFLIGLIEMTGEMVYVSNGNPILIFTSKPLLMPILILWMWFNKSNIGTLFFKLISVSLIFSLAGDSFLMMKDDNLFIFGLGSFLIAHILYIIAFNHNLRKSTGKLPIGGKITLAIPFVIFVATFLYILKDHILKNPETKDLFPPVIVYASTIGLMGVFAMYRMIATNKLSFRLILAGAMLFIASDSMIAINKFISPLPYASLLIMSTYITAQYLIVKGTLCHTSPNLK